VINPVEVGGTATFGQLGGSDIAGLNCTGLTRERFE